MQPRSSIIVIWFLGSFHWSSKTYLQRIDALDQWGLRRILGTHWHDFVRNTDDRYMMLSSHSHPLSSLIIFLSLGILLEWMRMQTPAKSFMSLLPRAGHIHLGGHILPGWRPSKAISLICIWSLTKPENWLRIDLSGDWCLCIALCTCSGACYYWIGLAVKISLGDTEYRIYGYRSS